MDNFSRHENHSFPPFLSSSYVRLGKYSDIMGCLEKHIESVNNAIPETDVSIIVLVNILKLGGCNTFGEYAEKVFIPNVKKS